MPVDERGPGPATIERVIAAWQRAQARLAEDDALTGDELVVNVDAAKPGQQETDVDAVLTRIVSAMLFASLREAEAAELARAMTARKQRYEKRGDMLRREILDIMMVLGRKTFPAPQGTVSVAELPGSVVITEPEDVPEDYMIERVVRSIDRRALKADLAEGVVVPGAYLSNGGYGLVFRPARAKPEAAIAPTTEEDC